MPGVAWIATPVKTCKKSLAGATTSTLSSKSSAITSRSPCRKDSSAMTQASTWKERLKDSSWVTIGWDWFMTFFGPGGGSGLVDHDDLLLLPIDPRRTP